jgi:CRP/FNR family transcriptional regulator, cyclic AMP receptor protein
MDAELLGRISLFAGLSKRQLQRLAAWTFELDIPEGEELATTGRLAHEFFVIVDGTAAVWKAGVMLRELGPGDFFGEIGLLETDRRTATVVATTPLHVIVMSRSEFRNLEQELPEVGSVIRAAVAERLAQ